MANGQVQSVHPSHTPPMQSSSSNDQASRGHAYTETSVGGNASAHFGDVYNYNYGGQPAQGPSQTPLHPSLIIPFPRDRDFVERNALKEIWHRISQPAARVGLVGLGGVGKTQIAIEYAYQRREADPHLWVFWVHASSVARFEGSCRQIAQQVHISNGAEPEADVLASVYTWLCDEQNGRWTMVVDNADSSEIMFGSGDSPLSQYLPSASHGSIIVTSRNREVVEGLIEYAEDIIEVGPMSNLAGEDAVALLTTKLKKHAENAAREDLDRLVQELDCMPLAITQAAAYISKLAPRMTVTRFLNKLLTSDTDRDQFLRRDIRDPRRDGRASNSVILTWHISFEHIRQTRPPAARLLSLMSLFDREGIPEELLQRRYSSDENNTLHHNEVKDVQADYDFDEDLSTLRSYGLVGIGTNEHLFDMHRLVQYSMRKWLELHGELSAWQSRYIGILDEAFPMAGDIDGHVTCQPLFPHIEATLQYKIEDADVSLCRANTFFNVSFFAYLFGRYEMATAMARKSAEDREKVLGHDNMFTLLSVGNLAVALEKQGKYDEAEEMGRKALAGLEKEVGSNHHSTLSCMTALSTVLQSQDKLDEAEELIRRALEGRKKNFGPSDFETVTCMSHLAIVLWKKNKLGEAEQLNRKALEERENVYGANYPETLTLMANLALVLQDQGKLEEAEELHRRALARREKVHGESHPDTLRSVRGLAIFMHKTRDYKKALQLTDRALSGFEKTLGASHPNTLKCRENRKLLLDEMESLEIDQDTIEDGASLAKLSISETAG